MIPPAGGAKGVSADVRDVVFLNGRYVAKADALVSVEDRGYQFADGVYEVIRYHGRRGLRLDTHLERLQESLAELRILGAPSHDEWNAILERLAAESDLDESEESVTCLYMQVTRGVAPRNHIFPARTLDGPTCVAY